jgi:hypothetical protein
VEASRRQIALLGAILVVLALVLYWQRSRQDATPEEFSAAMSQDAQRQAGLLGPPSAAPAARPASPGQIPAVQLASLERAQPDPADTGRDPFRFESARAPAPKGGPAGPGGGTAPPPATQTAPLEPPGPPPIPLKFIGIAKQGEGRLYAVLRDERGVYYGAEGDVVEGRYRVLRVSAEMVEMSYVDGRGRTRIPLSGGRP